MEIIFGDNEDLMIGIKKLIKAGIKLIIQPGGSIRDKQSISVANRAKVKMIFTGIRHFNH